MAIGLNSIDKPAPRWFRITKKLLSLVTNFTIAILMVYGRRADDITLLVIKLGQSFLMDALDTLMSNGEVYAKAETVEVTQSTTIVDTRKSKIMQYIFDTQAQLFLAINPATDVESWVADSAQAHVYTNQTELDAKLAILNEGYTTARYIGHGGVGTPK